MQEFIESLSTDFYTTGIKTTYFSLAKNMLIVMVLILTSKGMFDPSYNDLKFTVQNCNFVCTNLSIEHVFDSKKREKKQALP